jgi:hypothetical protein
MKKLQVTGMAVAAVLIFAGCVGITALGVLDESVPEESQCSLEIRNNLAVIIYDNQPVEWVSEGIGNSRVSISLPPGEHTFMTRHYETQSSGYYSTTYTITNTLTQTFLPGHSYRIYRQNIWLILFTITNIKIKDVTPKSAV